MAKLKVVQIVECGGPGGTGEQVAAICNGLDPARFETTLVYAVRGGTPDEYRAKCKGAARAVHVPDLTREVSPGKDAAALGAVRRVLAEVKPDVVHAHSSKAGIVGRAAAALERVPRVFYTPHGYGFLQQDRSAGSRLLYKTAERIASAVGEIVACSPSEAEFARSLSSKPVHVVCDAYLGDFESTTPHDGLVVGSCGRLAAARNPDAWVLLAQRLTDSRNGLKVLWIGGGEQEAEVRVHLENMNLLGKTELTGWLSAEEARKRLLGVDVFVHYSRWDAMPNAVLEAMAAGLPVVASDAPGCRDAVADGETGFIARSESELLERCQELVDDEPLRKRLGAAGRERVRKEFSRERMLGALSRLYAGEPQPGS